jgi:hypothetical protein
MSKSLGGIVTVDVEGLQLDLAKCYDRGAVRRAHDKVPSLWFEGASHPGDGYTLDCSFPMQKVFLGWGRS